MPYRSQDEATQARIRNLEVELAETKADLDDLRRRHAKAMHVLRMIHDARKLQQLLDTDSEPPRPPPSAAPPGEAPTES